MSRAILDLATGELSNVALTPDEEAANAVARLQGLKASIVAQAQSRLDNFARERGYDGILSACTYVSDPNFSIEGQRCVDLRGQTWAKLYEMLAEVETGTRTIPADFAEVESELPELTWPTDA